MSGEELFAASFLLALAVVAAAFLRNVHRRPDGKAADDPSEPFYSPYTTEFDIVCNGSDLADVLADNAVDARPAQAVGSIELAERVQQFEQAHALAHAAIVEPTRLDGVAICVLLDQSGSMAERMPRIAGQILAALNALETVGASTMLAGFTTVGWRGGRTRQAWIAKGRPPYPGRLCDLLHVIYSDFPQPTTAAQFSPLLRPAVCFENVDGEAIIWAERQLRSCDHLRKFLIVISDGAPVDDSTLTDNDPRFLWRHLEMVVGDCLKRGEIGLGAVGIDHSVDSLYPVSRVVSADDPLDQAIVDIALELFDYREAASVAPRNDTNPL